MEAAWTHISDPGLKQQVSPSVQGAIQQGLVDVATVEEMVERVSQKAAHAVEEKEAIQKKHGNAKGC